MSLQAKIEEHLQRRSPPTGFPPSAVLPEYGGLSIASVSALVENVLGVEPLQSRLAKEMGSPKHRRVLLLITDGLGYRGLEELRRTGHVPALDRLIAGGAYLPITSVFPSTTATAMATLATGAPPIAHGMIGFRLYLRETASVAHMLYMRTQQDGSGSPLSEAGLDPDRLLPIPTLCERLNRAGVATHVVLPRAIAGSGLSQVLYRGCEHIVPAVGFADMCVQARTFLEATSGPSCTMMYWPGLDSVAHLRGPDTEAFVAEAAAVDAVLARELVGRAEGTLLLLTSDHGFVTMSPSDYVDLSELGDLSKRLVRLPVGEPRASYLHTLDASEARVRPAETLGRGLVRLGRDRALSVGLLGDGQAHPETVHRLGDEVVVSTAEAGIYHPYPDSPRLIGMHGGLTEREMLVPLVASPL